MNSKEIRTSSIFCHPKRKKSKFSFNIEFEIPLHKIAKMDGILSSIPLLVQNGEIVLT